MIHWLVLAGVHSAPVDTAFPGWRKDSVYRDSAPAAAGPVHPTQDPTGWIVVKEHPALRNDSTTTIEVARNWAANVLLWPFDNVVRPALHLVLRPVRSAVDYGESTNMIDRGIRLTHPTGEDEVWLYPVTTVDGTESSRWGLVYMDNDLMSRRWAMRAQVAATVSRDLSGSASVRTARYTPLGLSASTAVSGGRAHAVGIRAPGEVELSDRSSTGQVSEWRGQWSSWLGARGPVSGSGLGLGVDRTWREVGLPLRVDQELPGTVRWLSKGDRGTTGREVDWTVSAAANWSDQNLAGAPTSGGPVSLRTWRTWAEGGGDVAGIEVGATRCFLLGNERYVYRTEDLRPYVDLDPREIIRILDPTTLRERLTQRKILVLGVRYIHIEELDPAHPVSYFNFPSMGGDAPARGYPSGYLMDHTVAGASMEYRWPIWKYVDGVSFLELAWTSPGVLPKQADRLAPGAGAGFRARLDRLFLFRGYLAVGRSGTTYSLTTSSEF